MEYFYSGGGNNRPYFSNRIKVKEFNTEMYEWCEAYPTGPNEYFKRFHVEWKSMYSDNQGRARDYEVAQFEWEEAAIMFALKFGEYICK